MLLRCDEEIYISAIKSFDNTSMFYVFYRYFNICEWMRECEIILRNGVNLFSIFYCFIVSSLITLVKDSEII